MLYIIIYFLIIIFVYTGILFYLIKQPFPGWEYESEYRAIPEKQKQLKKTPSGWEDESEYQNIPVKQK